MTKPSKLYEQLLANPGTTIPFRDFERLLEAFGWEHKRTKAATGTTLTPECRRS